MQRSILNDNQTPIFYLKDLRELHRDRLKYVDALDDIIGKVNVRSLKEELLREVPGLLEQIDDRYVVLTRLNCLRCWLKA